MAKIAKVAKMQDEGSSAHSSQIDQSQIDRPLIVANPKRVVLSFASAQVSNAKEKSL